MSEKMIHKTFRGEIRGVDEKNNTVTALVSGEKVDRYNEVILATAWSKGLANFKAHNVLVSSHRYSDLRAQIGEVPSIKNADDGLEAKFKYYVGEGNPEADWAWNLALKKKAAYSVGFISRKAVRKGDDGYDELVEELRARGSIGKKDQPWTIYTEVELLEISHVLVPAYPDALQKAMEDEDPIMAEVAKEVCEDTELEQVREAVQKMFDDLEEKAKYTCECIKCGHQIKTDKHCKDLKCSECGGQMRRAEKPGPGQESVEEEDTTETYGGEKSDPGEISEEAPKAPEAETGKEVKGELLEIEGMGNELKEIKELLTTLGEAVKKMGDALAEFLAKQADANASRGEEAGQDDYLKTILSKVEEVNEGLTQE